MDLVLGALAAIANAHVLPDREHIGDFRVLAGLVGARVVGVHHVGSENHFSVLRISWRHARRIQNRIDLRRRPAARADACFQRVSNQTLDPLQKRYAGFLGERKGIPAHRLPEANRVNANSGDKGTEVIDREFWNNRRNRLVGERGQRL